MAGRGWKSLSLITTWLHARQRGTFYHYVASSKWQRSGTVLWALAFSLGNTLRIETHFQRDRVSMSFPHLLISISLMRSSGWWTSSKDSLKRLEFPWFDWPWAGYCETQTSPWLWSEPEPPLTLTTLSWLKKWISLANGWIR